MSSTTICAVSTIDKELDGLMENFVYLMEKTNFYLQEINCGMEHLITCIMDVRHLKCVSKESSLRDVVTAGSISDVFSKFSSRNVVTFEHYSTIKRIIVTLCSKSEVLQMEMNSYEDKFRQLTQSKFLKRANFYDKDSCGNGSRDMVELIIATNSSWNECPVLMKVLDLESTITNAFRCEAFSLHLRCIDLEAKSVRLWFAASASTLKSVFPLTTEEWISITNHGVVELRCLEFHYKVQEKGATFYTIRSC